MIEPTTRILTDPEQQQLATGRLLVAIDSMTPDQLETAVLDPQVASYVMLIAARHMCPFCAADWPVEHSHGECPVIHVRPESLKYVPSADHVQCQAARLRAMAENWPFNPVIAAERG